MDIAVQEHAERTPQVAHVVLLPLFTICLLSAADRDLDDDAD